MLVRFYAPPADAATWLSDVTPVSPVGVIPPVAAQSVAAQSAGQKATGPEGIRSRL